MPIDYEKQIADEIDNCAETLWQSSISIFNEPEIAFKEYKACQLLTETLRNSDFTIETSIGSLPTAFRATYGKDTNPCVAILAEYDALVGMGHACGHNLIATAAIGAGMALAKLEPKLHGQVQIIGTP